MARGLFGEGFGESLMRTLAMDLASLTEGVFWIREPAQVGKLGR